jgi:hypothetical protein
LPSRVSWLSSLVKPACMRVRASTKHICPQALTRSQSPLKLPRERTWQAGPETAALEHLGNRACAGLHRCQRCRQALHVVYVVLWRVDGRVRLVAVHATIVEGGV